MDLKEQQAFMDKISVEVKTLGATNKDNLEEMGRFLKRRLERHFYAETGRRPVIIPLISGI